MENTLAIAAILTIATPTFAESLKSLPPESGTITNYHKQTVYTPKEEKIGEIDDGLADKAGKITAFIVGVGGFLGVGERSVAVPYSAVKSAKKNDKWWLTMDETNDSLKNAVGYTYDKTTTTWLPAKSDKK